MSAIRVLILGILDKEPMHGYDVRRTLESWHAEQWAHVAYGSIYSALSTMAMEGLVEGRTTPGGGRGAKKIIYTITEKGKDEFLRLLREYWWGSQPAIDPFQVALTFMDRLSRDEVLAALRQRANRSRDFLLSFETVWPTIRPPDLPRFMIENRVLDAMHVEAETRWIENTIEKLEDGNLP